MNDFPIRMSATLDGDSALVKALLTHPMETGLGNDEDGQPRPAHFITDPGAPNTRPWSALSIAPQGHPHSPDSAQ